MSELLVCPVTGNSLAEVDSRGAFDALGSNLRRLDANRTNVGRAEVPEKLLLRADGLGAYPVVDGIPILMAPEMLVSEEHLAVIDTAQDPYREAYEEMDFYNAEAAKATADISTSIEFQIVSKVLNAGHFPSAGWLDAAYDVASQYDAYAYLSPMVDMNVLQLGGKGIGAVKFLLAGAREAWLLTPMLGEAIFARHLAAAFGVEDKLRPIVGIAEQIPFRDSSFDRVHSGASIHHTMTDRAFPEIRRALKPGGKFSAFEPWRAPMYEVGIKIFGKREDVNCRPMELNRVLPLYDAFDSAAVIHHGAFTRYALIALGKLGLQLRDQTIDRITRFDDRLASKSSLRKYGSSVALLAESTDEVPHI